MMSHALPIQQWPDADRNAFDTLFTQGGLLDDQGLLGHWRSNSCKLMEIQYARWLGWLLMAEPEALTLMPCDRATPARLRAWLTAMNGLAPATRLGHVGAVVRLCRSIAPVRSWSAHQAILAGLHRSVKQHGSPRKAGRVLASDVLFDAGAHLVFDNAGPITHPNQAVRLRDGAIICLLALMPMRRRALSELALGTSLRVEGAHMAIYLDGAMTKNRQYWEANVPDILSEQLAAYLNIARPALLARSSYPQNAVWLGRNGAPLNIGQFTRAIKNRTTSLLKVGVTPHLFRDAAATTLTRASPTSARMIKPILGHTSTRIAEAHYIQADTIAAGRGLAVALEAFKQERDFGG
jgi:integrase